MIELKVSLDQLNFLIESLKNWRATFDVMLQKEAMEVARKELSKSLINFSSDKVDKNRIERISEDLYNQSMKKEEDMIKLIFPLLTEFMKLREQSLDQEKSDLEV